MYWSCKKNDSTTVNKYFILKSEKGQCAITITSSAEDIFPVKGTIWVHPFKNKIQADITTKNYDIDKIVESDESIPPIIYSVSNLANDIEINFSYSKGTIIINGKKFIFSNPFEICIENDCKNNIKSYKFLIGKNYEIRTKFEELDVDGTKYYYLSSFKFGRDVQPDPDQEPGPDTTGNAYHLTMAISLIYLLLYIVCL